MHDIRKKVIVYDTRKNKQEPKHVLVWFKIMINFQDATQNLAKSTQFWDFHIYSMMINTNMWSIGATICTFNNKLISKDFI